MYLKAFDSVESGEWSLTSGERGVEHGAWSVGSGEWKLDSEKMRVEGRESRVEIRESEVGSRESRLETRVRLMQEGVAPARIQLSENEENLLRGQRKSGTELKRANQPPMKRGRSTASSR